MHAWEAIQVTLEYIEEHIAEGIKIEVLAEKASLPVYLMGVRLVLHIWVMHQKAA